MKILLLVSTALSLALAAPALACSFAGQPDHIVDADEERVDVQAPTPPAPTDHEPVIKRGVGPQGLGPTQYASSCDDLGWFDVELVPGTDDRTPAESMGFRMELVDGTLPDGFTVPTGAFRLNDEGRWLGLWIDDAEDVQEPFDFTVEIFAVDLAGLESEEGLILRLQHPGSTGPAAGCAMPGAATPGLALLLPLFPLLTTARRVRSSRA